MPTIIVYGKALRIGGVPIDMATARAHARHRLELVGRGGRDRLFPFYLHRYPRDENQRARQDRETEQQQGIRRANMFCGETREQRTNRLNTHEHGRVYRHQTAAHFVGDALLAGHVSWLP